VKVKGMFSIRVFKLFGFISCYLKEIFFPCLLFSRKWVLPSRRPDGTQVYKNRALRTHFAKVSSNNNYERKKGFLN